MIQSSSAGPSSIVCTIQKLGLALDENSKRNKSREKRGQATYKDLLEPLRDKRMVFIFDENATQKQVRQTGNEEDSQTLKTTEDLFAKELHTYTITHAIEDRNVLRFHVDYFKPDGKNPPKPGETLTKRAIVDAILAKHDAATGGRKFNALFATASINDAIEYYSLFQNALAEKQQADPAFVPLNIAAVFSPPTDVSPDVKQLQEDLPQEQEDNQHDPDGKKAALEAIISDYNAHFGK